MRGWGRFRYLACALALALFSLASSAGEKQGKLVHVADTRKLSGFSLHIANLYNTNRLLFTLEAVLITVAMGVILGFLMDILVSRIGLDLNKRSVRE
jgi:hypothetical protein